MQVNDPARASEIAKRTLVIADEYANDPELFSFGASECIQACALELGGNGLNIASLTGEQWREHVKGMVGDNPDLVNDLLEELTSFAQTDDAPDEAPSLALPQAAEGAGR